MDSVRIEHEAGGRDYSQEANERDARANRHERRESAGKAVNRLYRKAEKEMKKCKNIVKICVCQTFVVPLQHESEVDKFGR